VGLYFHSDDVKLVGGKASNDLMGNSNPVHAFDLQGNTRQRIPPSPVTRTIFCFHHSKEKPGAKRTRASMD
jgi:hypothetical protein